MQTVEVKIIGLNLQSLFYKVDFKVEIFDIVEVKLKNTKNLALIINLHNNLNLNFELKLATKSTFSLTKNQKILLNFISEYYLCDLGLTSEIFTLFNKELQLEKLDQDINKAKKYNCLNILSDSQNIALDKIIKNISEKIFLNLLFGDTGSGKTEIYIHLMAKYLDKQILFLMPEISLTPQIELRLKKAFNDKIGIWHSKKTKKHKQQLLQDLINGKINIIAGARSALFLPFTNLALIIVDEEHDSSYKSNNNPKYNAKDLAIFLSIKNIVVVLGSATPSPNSYFLTKNNALIRLKNNYFNTEKLFLQDSESGLSKMLKQNIISSLQNNKQIIIFVPTRANFKSLVCNNCGSAIKCPNCSVSLSLHKNKSALICHYCNYSKAIQKNCICGGELKGLRLGTEEFKRQIKIFLDKSPEFNSKTLEIFDKDHINTQKKLEKILSDFANKKIDILIGTQMITKGHDYPQVGLSVIVDTDFFLNMQGYTAKINAYSLIYQVAGRVGRKESGVFLIQSKRPELIDEIKHDYEYVLDEELNNRVNLYPPFRKIALIKISHKDLKKAEYILNYTIAFLKNVEIFDFELVGFNQSQIFKIKNIYSYQIFIRSKKKLELQRLIKYLLENIDNAFKKYIDIDVDSLLI